LVFLLVVMKLINTHFFFSHLVVQLIRFFFLFFMRDPRDVPSPIVELKPPPSPFFLLLHRQHPYSFLFLYLPIDGCEPFVFKTLRVTLFSASLLSVLQVLMYDCSSSLHLILQFPLESCSVWVYTHRVPVFSHSRCVSELLLLPFLSLSPQLQIRSCCRLNALF